MIKTVVCKNIVNDNNNLIVLMAIYLSKYSHYLCGLKFNEFRMTKIEKKNCNILAYLQTVLRNNIILMVNSVTENVPKLK